MKSEQVRELFIDEQQNRVPACLTSFSSRRRVGRPAAAAGPEESVADEVAGEEQTAEEAVAQKQAVLVQREAQVHQLTHGSQ